MTRGFYKNMTEEQRRSLKSFQYKRMLEERRGHNYQYWNEKHEKMLMNGWNLYGFGTYPLEQSATNIEDDAISAVNELRATGYNARIVCGYQKDIQRTKYYSVIYKRNVKRVKR